MLLQEIVREFDTELMRLASLRAIVADLARPRVQGLESEINHVLLHPPAVPEEESVEEAVSTQEDVHAQDEHTPARRGYGRRAAAGEVIRRTPRRRIVETGAIASAIPAGPVVVSVAALKQERTHRQPGDAAQDDKAVAASVKPAPAVLTQEGSNDLARTLALRWLSGDNASL